MYYYREDMKKVIGIIIVMLMPVMVMAETYPVLWKEKIAQNNIWEFQKTVKKGCKDVAKEEWTDIDKYDLFFI